MHKSRSWKLIGNLVCIGATLLLASGSALAVPSFARQTGMACEVCHTVFPELTPFGRNFKLHAYTIDNLPQVSGMNANRDQTLSLNQLPPLSFMFQASYTSTKKSVPAFVQMTYDGTAGSFGWDNTDIRYARPASDDFLWGISANNDPTVQDLWNTTPAWQSPFDQRSATASAPGVSTMIAGGLVAAGVAGISVYGSWLDSVFVEFSAYHSAPAAAVIDSTSTNVVRGVAPYWRLAYERQWDRSSWEVGAHGVDANMFRSGGTALAGSTNRYGDWALDTQYQYIGDEHITSATATCIRERQSLEALSHAATKAALPATPIAALQPGADPLAASPQAQLRANWLTIERGINADEVSRLLGEPTNKLRLAGRDVWYYSYPALGNGSVFFTGAGRVSSRQPPF
jgi:hypothetical protein